jgi:hypothetical protein
MEDRVLQHSLCFSRFFATQQAMQTAMHHWRDTQAGQWKVAK